MYFISHFEPVCCSMFNFNYCFLTCIQVSQEARWSGIPISWRIFQFFVIHTVKGFSVVNETDVFFRNSLAFSMTQWMLTIWSLVLLPFWNPTCTSGSSQFTEGWNLAWRILSITLVTCEMSTIVWWFEHSLALPFFRIEMKTDLFQSYGSCWVFQMYWHMSAALSQHHPVHFTTILNNF